MIETLILAMGFSVSFLSLRLGYSIFFYLNALQFGNNKVSYVTKNIFSAKILQYIFFLTGTIALYGLDSFYVNQPYSSLLVFFSTSLSYYLLTFFDLYKLRKDLS